MRALLSRLVWSLLPLCASALGCNPSPVREEPPVDCSATDDYEFSEESFFRTFELDQMGDPCPWFPATDGTGLVACDHPEASEVPNEDGLCDGPRRAEAAIACEPIPDGPRCGSQDALRLTARRNQDWGSLYGDYAFATVTTDASAYEGIALWARAAPGTARSVHILLNDKYTANIALDDGTPDPNHESACVDEEIDESQVGVGNPTPGVPIGGGNIPGVIPSADACGNAYTKLLTVTERWQFYLLPFESFTQDPFPNRRLEGIDRESIRGMIVRAPKDIVLDFWIDDLGFYRKRVD